jgi:hypothetical protein
MAEGTVAAMVEDVDRKVAEAQELYRSWCPLELLQGFQTRLGRERECASKLRKIIGAEVGFEPTRPSAQRILSPSESTLPDLTKRAEPILTGLAAVRVMLRPVTSRDKMSSSSSS